MTLQLFRTAELPAPARPRSTPAAAAPRPRPRRRRFGIVLVLAVLLLAAAAVGVRTLTVSTPAPLPTAAPVPSQKLIARGRVRPVAFARVAALSGGTITRLEVAVGDWVEEQQEIARVRGPQDTEVVTAPWRGTIISLPIQLGDTVMAGSPIAVVGDVSRLEVETTDADEFIIGKVNRDQPVIVEVDALDRRPMQGRVERVAMLPEKDENGDEHYPVVVELVGSTRDLRLGMTVRVNFDPQTR